MVTTINKKGILALKEEIRELIKKYEEQRKQANYLLDHDGENGKLVYPESVKTKVATLHDVTDDLEELLK